MSAIQDLQKRFNELNEKQQIMALGGGIAALFILFFGTGLVEANTGNTYEARVGVTVNNPVALGTSISLNAPGDEDIRKESLVSTAELRPASLLPSDKDTVTLTASCSSSVTDTKTYQVEVKEGDSQSRNVWMGNLPAGAECSVKGELSSTGGFLEDKEDTVTFSTPSAE